MRLARQREANARQAKVAAREEAKGLARTQRILSRESGPTPFERAIMAGGPRAAIDLAGIGQRDREAMSKLGLLGQQQRWAQDPQRHEEAREIAGLQQGIDVRDLDQAEPFAEIPEESSVAAEVLSAVADYGDKPGLQDALLKKFSKRQIREAQQVAADPSYWDMIVHSPYTRWLTHWGAMDAAFPSRAK